MADATETVTVPEAAGGRLDRVLAAQIPALSRSRLKALILAGQVTVEARTVRDPAAAVNSGDIISVTLPEPEPAKPAAEAIPLDIVYEDDALIVLDKPAGLVVHPAAGHASGTLVNALIAHCGDSLSGIGGVKRPGIVHRLDKDTTGLMVVAKTDRAHRRLSEQFADKREGPIERDYLALVWGAPDRPRGTIDAPLDRHPHAREKRAVRQGGREAVTHWQVVERYAGQDFQRMTASRWRASSPAGWRPAAPTRSASISPISAIRSWATRPMPPASAPRWRGCRRRRSRRWRRSAARPCTPNTSPSSIRRPAKSSISMPSCPRTWRGCATPSGVLETMRRVPISLSSLRPPQPLQSLHPGTPGAFAC